MQTHTPSRIERAKSWLCLLGALLYCLIQSISLYRLFH